MKFILIALISLVCSNAQAFDLKNHAYNDFEGTIDSKYEIYMSLYPSEDGTIRGHYFYKNYEKKINLVGKYIQDIIYLEELDQNGVASATFEGKLSNGERDRFRGIWTTIATGKNLEFDLSLAYVGWAEWGHRYSDMGAESDEDVEIFAQKVKESIISSNYEWLAKQISYPIYLSFQGKLKKVENKSSFLKIAPITLTRRFKDKLSKYSTIDIFNTYDGGAMIGHGEIWMNYVGEKVNGPFTLKVISINNKMQNK